MFKYLVVIPFVGIFSISVFIAAVLNALAFSVFLFPSFFRNKLKNYTYSISA